ncbi:MAG TPA: VIT domain-containing protein [Fibrobacteria bacterium]|nr:VIT domain-containing protein [Fibrobacteria bacterium]
MTGSVLSRLAFSFWATAWIPSVLCAQIPLDSLHGPLCGMVDPETRRQVAISPAFTRVNVVVTDAIAQAVVSQRFVNPFKAKTEVVYLFPLPDQGAVHGMKYEYRDSLYVAKILERDMAQAKYDSIKQAGGQAALLLQERPNIFMQRIASMGPGETAYVEIRLSMPLKYADGELELAFPTRIGPRYQSDPARKVSAAANPWNPPEVRSGPEFQFNVLIQSGVELGSVYSPTHPVDIGGLPDMRKSLEERRLVEPNDKPFLAFTRAAMLKPVATYPNRDFVLRMKRASAAQDFSVALSTDSRGQGFFMLNLYPDPSLFAGKRGAMELVMLIDVSGSQIGWPLEREKEIALNILSRLTPDDRIDVLAFSNEVTYAFGNNTPVPAGPQNVAKAETFIRGLAVQGGTELLNAVNAALAVPSDRDKQRFFAFLTDGFITNETAILHAISGHPSKPTILTFGAGNSLNRYFLEECAKVGNGFATPVVAGDAAGPLVESAWKRIEAPQLEGIKADFGGLATADVLAPVSDRLYLGLPYRLSGKFDGEGTHRVTLTALKQGIPVTLSRSVDFGMGDALSWAVPKLWAREKIGQLTLAQGTTASNKAAIIRISEDYQVLSQYTAFLASEPQAVTPENDISGGMIATGLAEAPRTMLYFDLAVRGSTLFLDWKAPVELESIRIYDLHGKLLFTYRPESRAAAVGRWTWDGRDANGRMLGRGRYLISVQTKSGARNQVFVWNPSR